MLKAYNYRIYPTQEHQKFLAQHFGCNRFIYNWALDKKMKLWEDGKQKITCFDLIKQLPILKQQEETKWLNDISAASLQQSIKHLDSAFKSFYKGNGYPKFKSKYTSKQSYSIPQDVKIDFESSFLILPKFKTSIKIRIDREFTGKIKTCTVKKSSSGKYFISVLVDDGIELPIKSNPKSFIGIDLGLKDFLITSDGTKINNPHLFVKSQDKLAREQRRLARKVKGSSNYKKQKIKVARVHEKITNKRKDFLHKLSTRFIVENQDCGFCVEDLNVKGMVRNRKLSKAISDVAWGEFLRQLTYKAAWQGMEIIKIGRFDASSKLCSLCGFKNDDLKLSDREWTCEVCNTNHDRDINAAINIKNIGMVGFTKTLGSDNDSRTLVETGTDGTWDQTHELSLVDEARMKPEGTEKLLYGTRSF